MTKYAASWALRSQFPTIIHGRKAQSIGRLATFVLIALVIFGTLYVVVVNHSATQGYRMRDLEQRIGQIKTANKRMELQLTGYQSMQTIRESLGESEFVPVSEVKYASVTAPSVALK